MRRFSLLLLAVAVAAAGAPAAGATASAERAAAAPGKRAKLVKKTRLKAFSSCRALARYGRRHVGRGDGAQPPSPVGLPGPPVRLFGGPERGLPGAEPISAPQAQDDSSTTNVQEAGVDEPDVVKSRGSTIFAVAGEQLHAIDASGAAPKLLASLPVDGYGHQLLLFGKRVLVFSRTFGEPEPVPLPGPEPAPAPAQEPPASSPIRPGAGTVLLTEVDATDPAALKIVRREEVPGSFVSARLTGRTARVVISTPSPAIYEERLRGRVSGWMPRRVLVNAVNGRSSSRRLAPCRSVRRPPTFSGLELLTVLTIDMSKGLPAVDSDAIESGGEIVYASPTGLYVATQRWTDEPTGPSDDPPRTFTAIHRFGTAEPGETVYRASGRVPGFLLNQFSMSEHRGVLRVASTETPTWWGGDTRDEGQSFVTTLVERGAALAQLGQVGGLGRGERIYAVRFIDESGFVVTFRQVDPLYTIDLSNAREPRVLGELKILGYSAYLHPLKNDLLLGVGQDASEEGRLKGTQLSLFDVSNLRKPARLHQRSLGQYSSSDAEYDHHAFLWWPPAKLAAFPLQSHQFTGAVGFTVAREAGIGEAGRASHTVSEGYDAPVRRALVVGGRLYTLSDEALEQNTLDTLAEQAFLPLPRRP